MRMVTSIPISTFDKSIVLVGLMGAGKTTVGRRLANQLGRSFVDADDEIVRAAGCSVQEIFETYGEQAFRDVERRVIARLLEDEPRVLATGGGAFMNAETRDGILRHGLSIWLRADLKTLVSRTIGRAGRPLLKDRDPTDILKGLMDERYPVYASADMIIDTGDGPADDVVQRVVERLAAKQEPAPTPAVRTE